MKTINYTGSSKLISRIVNLLNRKAPLPLDGDGDPDWGTNGQFLTTDGAGGTTWSSGGGGGDTVSWTQTQASGTKIAEIDINGTSQNVYVPTAPTVNDATLTITQNGSSLGTFTANASANVTIEVPGGGGGSGGHTIEDASGDDMEQRANLQFIGAYLADNAGNNRTIANIVRTMTQAQFNNLSAAEKEGLIYISDAAGQLTASEVALAAIAGMSATTVQSGIAELKSLIGSIGRTVTTLVNEAVNIAASGNKTYAALTATALQAYDEIHFLANFGNVFVNGTATKDQMQNITAYTSPANGRLWFFAANLSASTEYSFRIRADSNGLQIINGSASAALNNLRIDGVKYN